MVVKTVQELAFRQRTRKGYVSCRVNIPVGICADCGAKNWDGEAEAIIEEAVSREVDKLPWDQNMHENTIFGSLISHG
jgi:hypothetical protein